MRQPKYENTNSYVTKFQAFYLRLSNIGRKLNNWILVYMLFIGLGDKHIRWATTVQNAFQKDVNPSELNKITAELLDKSQILSQSLGRTNTTIALFGKQSSKQ